MISSAPARRSKQSEVSHHVLLSFCRSSYNVLREVMVLRGCSHRGQLSTTNVRQCPVQPSLFPFPPPLPCLPLLASFPLLNPALSWQQTGPGEPCSVCVCMSSLCTRGSPSSCRVASQHSWHCFPRVPDWQQHPEQHLDRLFWCG